MPTAILPCGSGWQSSDRPSKNTETSIRVMLPKSPQNTHPVTSQTQVQLKDIKKKFPFRVLTSQDWKHWTTKGYIIIRQAVPDSECGTPCRALVGI